MFQIGDRRLLIAYLGKGCGEYVKNPAKPRLKTAKVANYATFSTLTPANRMARHVL